MLSFHAAIHVHLSHPPVGYQLIVGVRLFAWELRLETGPANVRSGYLEGVAVYVRRPWYRLDLLNHWRPPFVRRAWRKSFFVPNQEQPDDPRRDP